MKDNQFLVIGLGTFGMNVAKYLSEKGAQVIAIDNNEKKVNEISQSVTKAIIADATDDKVLKALNLKDIDVGIIAIGENLEDSILATLHLKELGIKKVIVKSINSMHAKIAAKLGADRIIYPELEMAKKLGQSLISPNIIEEIELSPEYNIVEIMLPKKFWGKTIRQSNLRPEFNVTIIAVKRKTPFLTDSGESDFKVDINIAPLADEELMEGDIVYVIGREADIDAIKQL
ncbi:MAG: hypothetical protein A2252_03615 [Elusimicrobia bacterium RIFOXYA2_FULL_39_19]|nr:MAG: hypothetical protein A2252_03615 [Elusimicrobia bacterium RIFOXYA2_FULL_39_19]